MTNAFEKQREIFRKREEKKSSKAKPEKKFLSKSSTPDRTLYEEMNAMCELSAMVYTTSYLLVLIEKGGYPISSWWWSKRKQLDKTELVMVGENIRPKTNIPVDKLLEFIEANTEALSKDPEIVGKDEEGEDDPEDPATRADLICTMVDRVKGTTSFLWTIDYKFGDTDIVYYVTVNRDLGRVTVSFRGSVTGNDWMQNLEIAMTELKTPSLLAKQGFDETIKVHKGFKTYLLDDNIESKEPRKYGKILKDLEDCYNFKDERGKKVHDGFSLYVTGHSLGGALSTLLAMKLASSDKLKDTINAPRPIINISVASPYVGGQAFCNSVKRLEELNWLRHIRVSNQNDLVPVIPPSRFAYGTLYEKYMHTGINVHLIPGEGNHEIAYQNPKTFASQFSFSPGERHAVVDYWTRVNEDKRDFGNQTIEKLYDTYRTESSEAKS